MVQVDVFWSYAIGAGMACAAYRQLEQEKKPARTHFFLKTVIYLSVLFAPSGIYLLWNFPGWETMFAGDRNLPAWLVMLFAVTNVTQGILGFYVAYRLIRKGRIYLANLQWVLGYFAMFFILVHGWDGTGYKRFFYPGTIDQWRANIEIPIYRFFFSDVALTLYAMGVLLLPAMFWFLSRWIMEGYKEANVDLQGADNPTHWSLAKNILYIVLVLTLGSVVAASVLIHLFGGVVGTLIFLPLFYLFALRKGGFIHGRISKIALDERV